MSDAPATLQKYTVQYGTNRVTCFRNGSQTRFMALDAHHASSDVISIKEHVPGFGMLLCERVSWMLITFQIWGTFCITFVMLQKKQITTGAHVYLRNFVCPPVLSAF